MTEMYFKQLLHEDCGCSSYLIGGKSTNEIAVIDPALEFDDVLELCRLRDFTVKYVIDTHIHADHVSGARALAAATGATFCMYRSAPVAYAFHPLDDGDVLEMGNLSLQVMHTPGHRPESITLLAINHARSESASMAMTGDTLLVGDVGRPDFGGEEGASELWDSLQRLLKLDDYVEVFPSHFDGPCGKGMCGRPSSTIGFERRFNPVLQVSGRDEFVRSISTDIPARPLNMDAIIATNTGDRDMPWAMPKGEAPVAEVDTTDGPEWIEQHHATVIDVREPDEYGRGHVPGARSIPQFQLADRLDEIPRDRDVLVVCQAGGRSLHAARFLQQVGYTRTASLRGGTGDWIAAGLPVETPVPA